MKVTAVLVGVGLLASGAGQAAADVRSDCTRTVMAYADAWDHKTASGFAAVFTEDATLDLGTGPARGRTAIAELFAKRNPGATTRHLMTNVVIEPTSDGAARGRSYLLLFAGPPSVAEAAPAEVSGFALVGEYHDRFRVERGRCLIAERRLVTVFRRAASPAAAVRAPN